MNNLLYYPYINLPRTDWTLRALIYYDNIGSIVPQEYFCNPQKHYGEFMFELVNNELVTPINPIENLDNPWESTMPFVNLIEHNPDLRLLQDNFRKGLFDNIYGSKFQRSIIHADKFHDNIFYSLVELGVAQRSDNNTYLVEKKVANNLMRFLATLISNKTDRTPTTDFMTPIYRSSFKNQVEQDKRKTLLTNLIPMPTEINLSQLLKFKEKHSDLLSAFRIRIENIVLNPDIKEDTPRFYNELAELHQRKNELSSKMNESKFNAIVFGSIGGVIGAYPGIAAASTTSAFIGALPGFASAIYSALQIEKAEDVMDQSGLKYLALMDKRLR